MDALTIVLTLLAVAAPPDPPKKPEPLVGQPYLEIQKQLKRLDSDEFDERQQASHELKKIGEPAVRFLVPLLKSKDAEQRLRSSDILHEYAMTILPKGGKVLPWIDCLPQDYPNREKLIKSLMQEGWEKDITDVTNPEGVGSFMGYRVATYNLVANLIIQGYSKAEIVELLDKMLAIERDWKLKGGRLVQDTPFGQVEKPPPPKENEP